VVRAPRGAHRTRFTGRMATAPTMAQTRPPRTARRSCRRRPPGRSARSPARWRTEERRPCLGEASSDEDHRDAGASATMRMPSEPPTRPMTIQGRRMPSCDEVRSLILPKNGLPSMASRAPVPATSARLSGARSIPTSESTFNPRARKHRALRPPQAAWSQATNAPPASGDDRPKSRANGQITTSITTRGDASSSHSLLPFDQPANFGNAG